MEMTDTIQELKRRVERNEERADNKEEAWTQ